MPENEDALDTARKLYPAQERMYLRLVEEVRFILDSKLGTSGVKIAALHGRVKPLESVLEKIERKRCDNPFSEIADFAGVRVVCLYEPDIPRVGDLVSRTFEVAESVDKSNVLGIDRMGYHGRHYVVSLGRKYSGARYDGLKQLRCEIQVRTVLQDAWAQISHHLVYKSEASVPQTLHRDLNNVSALLEIAQDVFDRARVARDVYVDEVQQKRARPADFISQPIDHETLTSYTEWRFPNLPVNSWLQEMLLADIDPQRFRSLSDIDQAVTRAADAVESYRHENPDWFKSGTDFITKSLGFVDEDFRRKHAFADRTLKAFDRYVHRVKASSGEA